MSASDTHSWLHTLVEGGQFLTVERWLCNSDFSNPVLSYSTEAQHHESYEVKDLVNAQITKEDVVKTTREDFVIH